MDSFNDVPRFRTVKDIMEKLKEFPEDAIVINMAPAGGYAPFCKVTAIKYEKVRIHTKEADKLDDLDCVVIMSERTWTI